jgi:hypothetical protein
MKNPFRKKNTVLTEADLVALNEAANVGDWMESRIHLRFTEVADYRFGDGYITRPERIILSSAIGDALNAFRAKVEADAPHLYQRKPWVKPEGEQGAVVAQEGAIELVESGANAMFIPLQEKSVRPDGTAPVKIIEPGWGSSGYYPPEVLERDGPTVFPAGTKMYWNHQTDQEEAERPEGDLNDLAAKLITDAAWNENGKEGAGLYAEAQVYKPYREAVDDMAGDIGLSIRTPGRVVEGEADGRTGPIVTNLMKNARTTVDFVTMPGAGGQILNLFEAARPGADKKPRSLETSESHEPEEVDMDELQKLQDANAALQTQLDEAKGNETELARLREVSVLREAGDIAKVEVAKVTDLPEITRTRLAESLAKNPPVKDGELDKDAFATQIEEAVQAETEYLQNLLGTGEIKGLGESNTEDGDETKLAEAEASLEESFSAMGMDKESAAQAAKGR